jgi:tetratricopeptide (TPR) repeat protein
MKYKGSDKDLKTMATENEAAYVLEGSVRKQNNHLRITAQLIDAMKDVHIWAESYRGTIDDIFDIQESVAEKIAAALQLHLTREEQQLLEKRYTDDTEAYELYLKGRHYWKQRNEEGLTKAIKYFERALQKDPDYALAFAGIADAYSLMGEYSNISRRELFPKQMAAVNKALALDNRLGEAHISKAISLMLNEWDWRNSERSFKRGIELSPRYATGHHWYAEWLLFMGYFKDALKQIELAVEHDPLSQGILKDKGIFYYYNGQFGSAIDMGLMTLQIKPEFAPVYRLLSLGYQGLEMFDEAEKYNAEWGKLIGNEIKTQVALADIYAQAGRTEEAWKIINEIEAGKNLSANDNRGMAQVYAGLNEKDMAFQYLNRSYALHEESLCSLKVDWKMDPLRDDKRFQDLLRRVNFEV